ncbi:MAG: family 43 glycosylhydrolase [Verrucomicrobiales bacterium]
MFRVRSPWLIFLVLGAPSGGARCAGEKTFCNPIDINYQYNAECEHTDASYRSGADPVIVNHQRGFNLFATNSTGWWHSKDLGHWQFVKPRLWPEEDMVSPAALSVRETLYLFPSTFEQRPIYSTTRPESGELGLFNPLMPFVPGAAGPWDPAIFHDEDTDRWFMYFGSSNVYPIYGIELDHRNRLSYIGSAKELIALKPDLHGWERFGRDHRDTIKPFIEGAWMTKHGGRYYLQYAAPGTEYNVYASGVYVCDSPMGKFKYAPNNPFSYKPGGFMTGAGHGNIFQDNFGNYWNTGTAWIGLNYNFERRIVMFPAGFDADGLLNANTRFGDFPHFVPTSKWQDRNELFTGWMLLSYRKPCSSSSTRHPYPPANATDENPRTFWEAKTNKPGEWLMIDLEQASEIRAVQINFADHQSGLFASGDDVFTQFKLHHSLDGRQWAVLSDLAREKRDRPNAYVELPEAVRTRFIKYEHVHVGARHLAVSDIRVFGHGEGEAPGTPAGLKAVREEDPRNVLISWHDVPETVGYNVLWGLRNGKLYQAYQLFADHGTRLELRALTIGQSYSFAIEAFNEAGVSKVSEPVAIE